MWFGNWCDFSLDTSKGIQSSRLSGSSIFPVINAISMPCKRGRFSWRDVEGIAMVESPFFSDALLQKQEDSGGAEAYSAPHRDMEKKWRSWRYGGPIQTYRRRIGSIIGEQWYRDVRVANSSRKRTKLGNVMLRSHKACKSLALWQSVLCTSRVGMCEQICFSINVHVGWAIWQCHSHFEDLSVLQWLCLDFRKWGMMVSSAFEKRDHDMKSRR